jgi:hypothetical protein
MSRTARIVLALALVLLLLAAGGIWMLATQGHPMGISTPQIDLTGSGPPWTNERTGETAGPDWVDHTVPFENTDGCGSENYASSISYQRGWYVQEWTGPRSYVVGEYLGATTLPKAAVFTGWSRPNERLWVNPADHIRSGQWKFLYVERADHIERWPGANFGCA